MSEESRGGVRIGPEQFEALFPFHLVVDPQLRIEAVGPSLARARPDVVAGRRLDEVLRLVRPEAPLDAAFLRSSGRALLLLQHLGSDLQLRSGVLPLDDGRTVLLANPWVHDASQLVEHGLSISDFAPHDPTVDVFHIVQSQKMALADSKRLADRLLRQRESLTEANKRLQEQERQQRLLALVASRTDNAVVLTDRAGLIVWVNEGFSRITGYTLADVRGHKPGEILQGPDTDRSTVARIRDNLRIGTGFREEVLNYTKSGRPYWVSIEVQPIRDESGEITNFMAIQSDISDRRAAEAAVQRERDFALQVMSLMGQGLTITDEHGLFEYVNEAYARLVGRSVAELIGTSPLDHVHPEDVQRLGIEFAARRQGRSGSYELRLLRPDGTMVFVLVNGVPRLREGRLAGTIASITDLSDRRRAEEALHAAKTAAESANRAKSEFLAHMSHEIRTPLNGVIGAAELLASTQLSRKQGEILRTMQTSAEHLLGLLNDLLDLSSIEAGRLALGREPFDVNTVLGDCASIFRLQAQGKGLRFSLVSPIPKPCLVLGDPLRLRQILVNLIGNAVKFTSAGYVMVSATLDEGSSGRRLHFEVRDTGIGMSREVLDRLFEPFSQGDGSVRRRFGGTGLGLAISRHITEAMGGTITVTSEPGEGTVFAVDIPAHATEQASSAPAGRAVQERIYAERILVVDDNPTNLEILRLLLERAAIDCVTLDRGAAAVEQCAEGGFDVVLVDLQMPDMDGFETARRIRTRMSAAGLPQPRIIAITADARSEVRQQCTDAGIDSVLLKPVRFESLLRCVAPSVAPDPGGLPLVSRRLDLGQVRELFWEAAVEERSQLREMFDAFSSDAQRQMLGWSPGALTEAAEQARREFHSLRGSMASYGLQSPAELLLSLEGEVGALSIVALAVRLQEARNEFAVASEELRQIVPWLRASSQTRSPFLGG